MAPATAIITRPPTQAVVPAISNVPPRLNSLIEKPSPTAAIPAATAAQPSNNTMTYIDLRSWTLPGERAAKIDEVAGSEPGWSATRSYPGALNRD
jgi:hypothetical protein